jgi:hypothetical protein
VIGRTRAHYRIAAAIGAGGLEILEARSDDALVHST